MIQHRYSAITFLMVLLLHAGASASIDITEQTRHYPVTVEAGQMLKKALTNSTPIRKNNRHWYGETQWNINPRYRFRKLSGGCYVNERTVELSIIFTLPELEDEAAIPPGLQLQFNLFYNALYQHELGHKELGLKAANEVYELLSEPNIFSDCGALQLNVNDEIRAVISKYQRLNQQYDIDTQHGKTQGAVIQNDLNNNVRD